MTFDNYLFRASSIGHLMTEPQAKADKDAGNLSESAKTHLIDCYVAAKYGRHTDIRSKYIDKGNQVEEDSITLYSLFTNRFYKKNEERIDNEYISGCPDLFEGIDIRRADIILDIKSSWDIFTFFRVLTKKVNPIYYWQGQAYLWLTGAQKFKLVYCLVNTPEALIQDEERKLFYQMNAVTTDNPLYIDACGKLRELAIYDDINMSERVLPFEFERDIDDIDRMRQKVEKGRAYLNQFEKMRFPEAFIAEYDANLKTTIIHQ